MPRKLILALVFFFLGFFALTLKAEAQEKLYFFYGDGCPHCAKEEIFLEQLKKDQSGLEVHSFEVWYDKENRELMKEVGQALQANFSGVPITVIGQQYVVGFANEQTTGQQIKNYLRECRLNVCEDVVGKLISKSEPIEPVKQIKSENNSQAPEYLDLPLFGRLEVKTLSLPILTIAIAAVDGFNPCAMWVLLFLISLLLGMKNRKKMWILGSAFILASGLVYFGFMVAWLNLLLFLGFIVWIRWLIGGVAIASGLYHLREFFVNKDAACKVTGSEKKQKIFGKLKDIVNHRKFIFALVGIILLAFAVNLVEAICSAGLPAVYTQILTLSDLSTVGYYSYILLYIFIFMLDDLLVFFIAMTTLRVTGLTQKFSRISNLIGGLVILLIGLILIFRPGWLMFG